MTDDTPSRQTHGYISTIVPALRRAAIKKSHASLKQKELMGLYPSIS